MFFYGIYFGLLLRFQNIMPEMLGLDGKYPVDNPKGTF